MVNSSQESVVSSQEKKQGFTMIELLIVVAIMVVVGSVIVVAYTTGLSNSRNVQRKNDMKQYSIVLANYSLATANLYPASSSGAVRAATICYILDDFGMTKCLDDQKYNQDSSYTYWYRADAARIKYVLWAKLEGKKNMQWVYCSNGKAGEIPQSVDVAATVGVCPSQLQ